MAEQARFVFVPYMNVDHSEVSTKKYLDETKPGKGLDLLLGSLESNTIPFVLSAQGVDLELIARINPALSERISNNSSISFTKGMYTHSLPSYHPENLDMQLSLGKKAIEKYGKGRVAEVGMLPEFDVSRGILSSLQNAGWEYVLLQNGVNKVYEWRENIGNDITPSSDLVFLKDAAGNKLKGIVTQGNPLRDEYLHMLRGITSPDEMIDAIARETEKAGKRKSPMVPFLIDFETAYINDEGTGRIYDVFDEFAGKLSDADLDGKIRVSGFDSSAMRALEERFSNSNVPDVFLHARNKEKWLLQYDTGSRVADSIHNLNFGKLSEYHQKAALWAGISDYYSTLFDFARDSKEGITRRLPVKTQEGKTIENAIAVQGDRNRIKEVLHAVESLEHKTALNTPCMFLSPESREKMKYLHEIFGGK